MYRVEYTEI